MFSITRVDGLNNPTLYTRVHYDMIEGALDDSVIITVEGVFSVYGSHRRCYASWFPCKNHVSKCNIRR